MRGRRRDNERGMALALAIFALVVVGGLVAGAFIAGHLEQRTGRGTLYAAQAADAAEAGAAQTLADWDLLGLGALAPGTSVALPTVPFAGRASYRPTVSRLNEQLFLVKSLGTRGNANGATLARRTVAVVARLASLGAGPDAALTVAAPVQIAGSEAKVSGKDDCAPGADQPATRIVAPTSPLFTTFGDVTFDRLKAHADVVLSETVLSSMLHPSLTATGRSCDVRDASNWGEPLRSSASAVEACRRYFPVVYAKGPRLELTSGGRGQGILLVEGNLDITGDFDFSGLIVTRGSVRISGARTRIAGALMAAAPAGKNTIGGAATIRYSSCALKQALSAAAFAEPLGQRSWVQVY